MTKYSLKKNKVLHIITSLGDGGAEGVLYRLIKNTKKNFHHEIITLTDDIKYEKYFKRMKIKIIRISFPRGSVRWNKLLSLYKILKKKRGYIIQTWLYHADLLGGLLGRFSGNKKIFWNIRTSEIFVRGMKLSTIFVVFINALLSYFIPKKIVICSKNSIPRHIKVGYSNNFELIHNGYDLNFYPDKSKKILQRKNFKLDKRDFIVGNVARYNPVKNHTYLLKIFSKIKIQKRVPKLILIGSKIDKSNKFLIKKIKELKIEKRVILLGKREDAIKIYPIFDLFILSSKSEGFPNVLAEAMMNKNIVFSTNVGEVDQILPNNKYVLPLNDHQRSAEKINNYFKKNDYKKILFDRNLNREIIFNFFSLKRMSQKYTKLWKS